MKYIINLILIACTASVFAQELIPSECCAPVYYWDFDQLANKCNDYAPECREVEISHTGCDKCLAENGTEGCCNFYQTHGTPSLENKNGRWLGKLWFDYSGGEGLKLKVCDLTPQCYFLEFDFIKTHALSYDNFLKVFAVNNEYLPENLPSNPSGSGCFDVPPFVPASAMVEILSIPLSQFPISNTTYHHVQAFFQTNTSVIKPLSGFSLWFYPSSSNSGTQKAVGIDDISLGFVHDLVCEETLEINELDAPIAGIYSANDKILINGNIHHFIEQGIFYGGNRIQVSEKVSLKPPSDNYVLLEIKDNCLPCTTEIDLVMPVILETEVSESNDSLEVSQFEWLSEVQSDEAEQTQPMGVIFYLVDIYKGPIATFSFPEGKEDFEVEEISQKLNPNYIYYIIKTVNGRVVGSQKYIKFN